MEGNAADVSVLQNWAGLPGWSSHSSNTRPVTRVLDSVRDLTLGCLIWLVEFITSHIGIKYSYITLIMSSMVLGKDLSCLCVYMTLQTGYWRMNSLIALLCTSWNLQVCFCLRCGSGCFALADRFTSGSVRVVVLLVVSSWRTPRLVCIWLLMQLWLSCYTLWRSRVDLMVHICSWNQ